MFSDLRLPGRTVRRSYFIGLGVFVLLLLVAITLQFQDPASEGQPLTFWLNQINKGDEVERSSRAIQAIGPRCLPALSRRLGQRESWLHRTVRDLLARQRLLKLGLQDPAELRLASLYALTPFGMSARQSLTKIDFNQPDGQAVAYALGGLGLPAQDALTRACQSTNKNVRLAAALALARIANEANAPGYWQWSHQRGKCAMNYGYRIDDAEGIIKSLSNQPSPAAREAGEEWAAEWNQQRLKDDALRQARQRWMEAVRAQAVREQQSTR